jgi:ParB/RepB/Spo0J family partition protein
MKREFKEIQLSDIILSCDNKRKVDEKSESFAELKASIEAGGVRVPVQVRLMGGKYELRYGERRYRASKAVGLKTIPAIITENLSEEDALDLTYIENKFREDLKPLEEAAEVALLLERFGGDAKAVAKKIGRNAQWVYVRANIAKGLIKPWRLAVEGKDKELDVGSWNLSHLSKIARLPERIQNELLEEIKDSPFIESKGISSSDLEEIIGKELHLLSKAKWQLDDETLLPKAGACSKCPKRSGHQPMLWFDTDEQVDAGDQCLDGFCWKAKEMSWLDRTAADLRQKHANLVMALSDSQGRVDHQAIEEKLGLPLAPWQYTTCSKSTKGAIPAMYVNGKGAGKLTYIKIKDTAGPRSGKIKGTPTPLKQRHQQLDAKRWAQVLLDLRDKVGSTKVTGLCLDDKVTGLMALVSLYGNKIPWQSRADIKYKEAEQLIKSGKSIVLIALWETFKPTLDDLLTYNGPITQTPKRFITDSEWIANLIGVDIKTMFKEVAKRKGFTEPKSWSSLNSDGTPKSADKPKKKKAKTKKSKTKKVKGICRICGCSDDNACIDKETGEPCHWVEDDLCSNCESMSVKKKDS